ncbi:carbon-nitrogen hydrolase family protein [Ahrensia marina]|uniref:Nitrilase n=1 Tax=Ahrensia marina TaxID=1514904 RepID=A0A0M9GL25_9HYPH|nr:carbon-nitrogen hydrolase family protein [Ahrensia marina]KPB00270.1 nitrilase [Ahrensia marina]
MRCAAIQMRSGVDVAANIAAMQTLIREAAADGAQYAQTPEMTGLLQKSRKDLMMAIKPDEEDPVFEAAAALAKELKVWVHIGSTPILLEGGKVANRAALFSPQGIRAGTYDKIHMFDVDLDNGESWRESAIYEAGEATQIVQAGEITLGLAICYDVRFPEIFRQQALAGANVLTTPAAFTKQTGQAHWHVLQRARAIENGAYVIAAAQGGTHEDTRETYGHSLIVDPWGNVLAEKDDDQPGHIVADIDISKSEAARAKIPNLKNARPYRVETQHVD